jgi:hypothetical protein
VAVVAVCAHIDSSESELRLCITQTVKKIAPLTFGDLHPWLTPKTNQGESMVMASAHSGQAKKGRERSIHWSKRRPYHMMKTIKIK